MKFILIVATGRSGSTTLQRIINTIPNSNIVGENWGAIANLLESYRNLKKTLKFSPGYVQGTKKILYTYEQIIDKKIKPAWYNCFDIDILKKNFQDLIIAILENKQENTVLGFKGIRWYDNISLLAVFIELFPNTRIICHIRENIKEQCTSGWWKETDFDFLTGYNNQLREYALQSEIAYFFSFEKMFEVSEITDLFLFLEETLDLVQYKTILSSNFTE